jgi:hypothetical protein
MSPYVPPLTLGVRSQVVSIPGGPGATLSERELCSCRVDVSGCALHSKERAYLCQNNNWTELPRTACKFTHPISNGADLMYCLEYVRLHHHYEAALRH